MMPASYNQFVCNHLWKAWLLRALVILGLSLLDVRIISGIQFTNQRQADYVKKLSDYAISIPQRVHADGQFISHDVRTAHAHTSTAHGRYTRNSDQVVHYRFNVSAASQLHVELTLNRDLISPGMVIERRKAANFSFTKMDTNVRFGCHYIGHIRGQTLSRVALSTCDGLTGFIHTDDDQYFIEPVKGYRPDDSEAGHPHIVYRHTSIPAPANHDDHQPKCSLADAESPDIAEIRDQEVKEWRKSRPSFNHLRRRKRSYSTERYVETLVVVDNLMMNYYKDDDLQMYVLTVMNMVAAIYHDVSIGNSINIVLVRLMILEDPEEKLEISHHADKTLDSFCKWQKTINPKDDSHPNHHDVAVLTTRFNICSQKDQPCSTLGMAQVAGMCQSHRSCSINQDTGLALAYTIAHELGHNFNMKHDETKNGCEAPYQIRQHVMSPQLVSDSTPLIWSNCSRDSITKFLDRDWGFCLNDEPEAHPFTFPAVPPGVMYDADHQCRLQYGPGAQLCDGIEEICATLWCKVDKKCMTRLEAAVEGTYCDRNDKNKWCMSGQCGVITERAAAVDGDWGPWTGWSGCSRTCGAGVSHADRHCENPAPSNGGKYCLGERKRFRICNTDACPEGDINFRQIQCSEFDTVPYREKLFAWETVFAPATPCQLHCKPRKHFFSVVLKDIVTDGTPCRIGHRDMCISGKCMKIACDWAVNSVAKEDRCGVCHGDGSTCTTVKKKYTEQQGLGYVEATVIPKDARNIRVEEVAEANNYLALRNQKGEYFLNGHWYIQWSGDYDAAGTVVHYERTGNKESFFAPGPLKEPLHIMLLFQSENPGLVFEYTVPNHNASARRPVFSWQYTDFTHCTLSCGGGIQRSAVTCTEVEAGAVEDKYCDNIEAKPYDKVRVCNTHMCPAKWWYGPWQPCSVSCGNDGLRKRTVICVRSVGPDEQIALDDRECKGVEKPEQLKTCIRQEKCPVWLAGEWSQTCTGDPCAVQKREVTCSSSQALCGHHNRPEAYQQCSNVRCGQWTVGQWSDCTQDCGTGVQVRMVRCVQGTQCLLAERPSSQQYCNQQTCTTAPPSTTTSSTSSSTSSTVTTTTTPITVLTTQFSTASSQQSTEHDDSEQKNVLSLDNEYSSQVSSLERITSPITNPVENITTEPPSQTASSSYPHSSTDGAPSTASEVSEQSLSTESTVAVSSTTMTEDTSVLDINLHRDPTPNTDVGPRVEVTSVTLLESDMTVTFGLSTAPATTASSNEDFNGKSTNVDVSETEKNKNKIADNDEKIDLEKPKEFDTELSTTGHSTESTTFYTDYDKTNVSEVEEKGDDNGSDSNSTHSGILANTSDTSDVTTNDGGSWKVYYSPDMVAKQHNHHDYNWVTARWQECDAFCGGGNRWRRVTCMNNKLRLPVPNLACDNSSRPSATSPCNTQPCIEWSSSVWSECNVGCGQLGIQRRIVYCTKPNYCDIKAKPIAYTSCFNHCIKWVAGSWSQCSASCGGGEQYRHVMCINQTSYEPARGCTDTDRPTDEQACNSQPCSHENAALSDWDRSGQCTNDIYPGRICHTLRRIGHCKQRYVQNNCCRTCLHHQAQKRTQNISQR